jgi:two-component system cell cycle response regulator DivK
VNAGRKTILVADDTDDITELTATVLRLNGCNVVTARDGSEALDMARKCMPDLIFMDLSMPVMNGFEATQRILAIPALSSTPVVATSAHCDDQDWKTRALEVGCVECVLKPLQPDTLEKLVHRFFGGC